MTVQELIDRLKLFDPKLRIVTNGYEGGYTEIDTLDKLRIALDVNTEWYYGKHELADDYSVRDKLKEYTVVDAVFVG